MLLGLKKAGIAKKRFGGIPIQSTTDAQVHIPSARKSATSPPKMKSTYTNGENARGLEVMSSGRSTRPEYRSNTPPGERRSAVFGPPKPRCEVRNEAR